MDQGGSLGIEAGGWFSASTTGGENSKARATATRCISPRDILATGACPLSPLHAPVSRAPGAAASVAHENRQSLRAPARFAGLTCRGRGENPERSDQPSGVASDHGHFQVGG